MAGLAAALAVMTTGVAGCGAGGSGDVTLRLVAADYGSSPQDASKTYWDALIKRFEANNPGIKVEVSVYSWHDVDQKVKDMVGSGDAPDIAQIGAYADYASQGKLYRADDVLSIPTQANFLTSLSQAGQVNRTQYGLPFVSSTRLLFYNKTLFKDAGIAGAPQSWSELQADAKILLAHGVKTPYALPLGPEEAQAETMMWLLSGGDGYVDDVGTYSIDSKQNIRTFDWLKDELVGRKLTGPTPPAKLNRADAFAAFAHGDVGMLNGHPTLMRMAADKGVKFGMVPMPGINGKARATMGVADWMMAFKQNGHREETGKFLDYVYEDGNVLDFCREYDLLPVTTSASQEMSEDESERALAPFLKELADSELYPQGKTSWAQTSASIKKRIGKAVGPGGNPASVLGALQREAVTADNSG